MECPFRRYLRDDPYSTECCMLPRILRMSSITHVIVQCDKGDYFRRINCSMNGSVFAANGDGRAIVLPVAHE